MFESVLFDIVHGCNAKCPLCVTARTTFGQKIQYISVDDFARAIDRLLELGLATPGFSTVGLFNWGEPILHPDLESIVAVLADKNLYAAISTNASRATNFSTSTKHFRSFIFSLPGWSQDSQDKIHGLRHDRVVANMEATIENMRARGFAHRFTLAYHVYQFNCFDEFDTARRWCGDHDVDFEPYFAYINDYEPNKAFLKGTMDRVTLEDVSKRLFLHYYEDVVRSRPDGWRCPQWDRILTLNHKCEVVLCCVLPETHESCKLGSVFELSRQQILELKTTDKECDDCINCGVAYWAHNPKRLGTTAPPLRKKSRLSVVFSKLATR
jgi:MoaA/NifB/PqqE/SkfB family radical SAM enzyme